MKYILSVAVFGILTSCSPKVTYDLYTNPCAISGKENVDLLLFKNNRFLLYTLYCQKYFPTDAFSYGTFARQSDTAIVLQSFDNKIDVVNVYESKVTSNDHYKRYLWVDSCYVISILDKYSARVLNEHIKIILNQKDTLIWGADFGIRFNPSKPYINSIQIAFPDLNFLTPVYYVKDKANNIFEFQLNVPRDMLCTIPQYLILDKYTLVKQDSMFACKTRLLTRSVCPVFIYKGTQRKKGKKTLEDYQSVKERKEIVKYLFTN